MISQNNEIADHWIVPVVQKLKFTVNQWSAWSPALPSIEGWQNWFNSEEFQNPLDLPHEVSLSNGPSVSFLPLMLRKKLTPVSKVLLYLSNQSLKDYLDEKMQVIFSSRYGEANSSVELLESVAKNEPSSPMAFSRSVHNFSVGLNSIAMQNNSSNTAIAAMHDTFYAGLVESLMKLYSSDAKRILFVYAEDATHQVFKKFYSIPCPFGMSFILEKDPNSTFNEFMLAQTTRSEGEIIDSLHFLKNVINFKKKIG